MTIFRTIDLIGKRIFGYSYSNYNQNIFKNLNQEKVKKILRNAQIDFENSISLIKKKTQKKIAILEKKKNNKLNFLEKLKNNIEIKKIRSQYKIEENRFLKEKNLLLKYFLQLKNSNDIQ